jgi:hypothetical protein
MGLGSLRPENAIGSAIGVPNGEYTITAAKAHMLEYTAGRAAGTSVPSGVFTFTSTGGEVYEQNYSAGKSGALASPDDGKRFAAIAKKSDLVRFVASIITGGFPVEQIGDDITVFEGTRVVIENVAKEKIDAGDKDKTLALVAKVLAMPGKSAKVSSAGPTTAPSNGSAAGGELDAIVIDAIQTALAQAPANKLTRLQLGTKVFLAVTKEHPAQAGAIKKIAQDAVWLAAQAEAGGWSSTGEEVKLG